MKLSIGPLNAIFLAWLLWGASLPAETRKPVVIELFTSQGCSSCPAAEALIKNLDEAQPLENLEIIPLVFHVDYWDHLGWKDPFASRSNTLRQYAYAKTLETKQVYTPQALINGRDGLVGHDRKGILAKAKGISRLQLARLDETVKITGLLPGIPLWVAWTRDEPETKVTRGENEGRSLNGHGIVMRLETLNFKAAQAHCPVPTDQSWHLIAFQQRRLGPILSAGRLDLN